MRSRKVKMKKLYLPAWSGRWHVYSRATAVYPSIQVVLAVSRKIYKRYHNHTAKHSKPWKSGGGSSVTVGSTHSPDWAYTGYFLIFTDMRSYPTFTRRHSAPCSNQIAGAIVRCLGLWKDSFVVTGI